MAQWSGDTKQGWIDGWKEGWREGWESGRRELAGHRRLDLKAPTIDGAIDGVIPYDVLVNGLTIRIDVTGFFPTEYIRIYLPEVPPVGLTLTARLVVTQSDIDAGFALHSFNDIDVQHFAGKRIEAYFERSTVFPVPESPHSEYLVENGPRRG